jgi:predicted glutamine amidotransferase
MCELFAMSSSAPTNVHFSLEEFSRHGGLTGPHKDGWGLAYYSQGDVKLVREPLPASDSACVRYIQDRPFATQLVISHIRKATQGAPVLGNCQPFIRELGGRMHVFAHNGDLDLQAVRDLPLGTFRPVGGTDSELAFCALLGRLTGLWLDSPEVPPLGDRLPIVEAFAAEIRQFGPANFLYADGDALFVHAHRRMRQPAGLWLPGLHLICRHCSGQVGTVDTAGLSLEGTDNDQHVVLTASVPLTSESGWRALSEGEIVVVRDGRIVPGT